MPAPRVAIVGAGVGGLVAALDLAAQGCAVELFERAATPGGKLREVEVDGVRIDAGPTVFTMRWVFDELFAAAGLDFGLAVGLERAAVLARHGWTDGSRLDLHAELAGSADAIGDFAGAAEARRFLAFAERARGIYRTLEGPFLRRACASPVQLMRAVGLRRFHELWRITPFQSLWRALGAYFRDPRLRQLFGRYATYCGSSPFLAPATLMLVAHVEQEGVWLVAGGMHRLAVALADAATARGARIHYGTEVRRVTTDGARVSGIELVTGEAIVADAVVVNADSEAVTAGLFGAAAARATPRPRAMQRSLSAITWQLRARAAGFALERHNVFFSRDYPREFEQIFGRGEVPEEPTVYLCAQDRGNAARPAEGAEERLFCLVNAPPDGDRHRYDDEEIARCEARTFDLMARCGLTLARRPEATRVAPPDVLARLFPGTGGALYGPASHGWMASFQRPGATTKLSGLYLAGGSTHPGPGVPMAALSGRLAAAQLLQDHASTARSRPVATPGGTSMR